MATNNFLPFCPTDTGTNLLTQVEYAAASDRTNGNQPGVASSKLNNKAIRQAAFVASQVAQAVSDVTQVNVLDDGVTASFLAKLNATILRLAPKITTYAGTSGNWNAEYVFFIASGNATVGATYTNNAVTYTVTATVASAVMVKMTGNGAPATSGTLTKASGSGDSTLTFYAVRAPLFLRLLVVGGGGGGGGSDVGGGNAGSAGQNSTFGSTVANGGSGGPGAANSDGGAGGGYTAGIVTAGVLVAGARGTATNAFTGLSIAGGNGGNTPLGGGGSGGAVGAAGNIGTALTGGGGGGGGGTTSAVSGGGGGGGGYVNGIVNSPASTYAYAVGGGGAGGSGGSSRNGATGGSGFIMVEEHYQ